MGWSKDNYNEDGCWQHSRWSRLRLGLTAARSSAGEPTQELAATTRCHLFKLAIPVLHVHSSIAAEEFYCRRLGFLREFTYLGDQVKPDPCHMRVVLDDAELHIYSF